MDGQNTEIPLGDWLHQYITANVGMMIQRLIMPLRDFLNEEGLTLNMTRIDPTAGFGHIENVEDLLVEWFGPQEETDVEDN